MLSNGQVLVTGGQQDAVTALSSTELYDPATATWSATGSLATPRDVFTATLLADGKVLVAGGNSGFGGDKTVEIYVPAKGIWLGTDNLAGRRSFHTATLLLNGEVLVTGGFGRDFGQILTRSELYDEASRRWTITGSLATGRQSHTATLLPNGKLLVVEGADGFTPLASAELYK